MTGATSDRLLKDTSTDAVPAANSPDIADWVSLPNLPQFVDFALAYLKAHRRWSPV